MFHARRLAMLACAVMAVLIPAATAGAAITTRTVDYGPYTIPAGAGDPHDSMSMGMIANQISTNVAKPCTDCTIIAIRPDLVDASGARVNVDSGPMIHHALLAANATGKSDATCRGTVVGALGERFFAAGNERTPIDVTSVPYGYKIGRTETWNLVVDLMNWATTTKTVRVRMTYTYATGSDATSRAPLRPVWLDLDQCGDSEVSVPTGPSDSHYDWTVNVPGRVIQTAGHVHDHGVRTELTNESAGGTSICNSVAGYGETPGFVTPDGRRHVSSMTSCLGNPISTVASGQRLRLHTLYDVPVGHPAIDDAMGIMIAYINPS